MREKKKKKKTGKRDIKGRKKSELLCDFASSVEQWLGTGEQELEGPPGLASNVPFSIIPSLLKIAPRPEGRLFLPASLVELEQGTSLTWRR